MQSFGYILNQRPFRDNSVLVDIFSEDFGRICCVARPAKKRGKILKGSLEPFRYLKLQWIGKGEVQTLTEADERGRHTIPASEMLLGLYVNELILLFTHQHIPQLELFAAYKYTLHKLGDSTVNRQILMRFEMYLLGVLGYTLDFSEICLHYNAESTPNSRYIFTEEQGLIPESNKDSVVSTRISIRADVLLALQDIKNMQESHWRALRVFLDQVLLHLSPRAINTRKLLNL